MANRLTRIYTRTGDDGTTGLADGTRVAKDCPRVEALGAVDELNSVIGLVLAASVPDELGQLLTDVQHRLFDLGAELATPAETIISDQMVVQLEHRLEALNTFLPPLREFILPGGAPAVAHCHHARSVCRRAERRLLSLGGRESVNPASLRFLNRLSDLLFVVARVLAPGMGRDPLYWQRTR